MFVQTILFISVMAVRVLSPLSDGCPCSVLLSGPLMMAVRVLRAVMAVRVLFFSVMAVRVLLRVLVFCFVRRNET